MADIAEVHADQVKRKVAAQPNSGQAFVAEALLNEGTDGVVPNHAQKRVPHGVLAVVRALRTTLVAKILTKQQMWLWYMDVVSLAWVSCRCEMFKNLLFYDKFHAGGNCSSKGAQQRQFESLFGAHLLRFAIPRKQFILCINITKNRGKEEAPNASKEQATTPCRA